MDSYAFFYRGRWRQIGDKVRVGWFHTWRVAEIHDGGTALLERGDRKMYVQGTVRVS